MAGETPGTPEFLRLPLEQRQELYNHAEAAMKLVGAGNVPASAYFSTAEINYIQGAQASRYSGWQQEVQKKFPSYAQYFNIKEIADVLHWALNSKMGPAELESALHATTWWKTHSQEQRQWYLLNATDPASSLKSVNAQIDAIKLQAEQMGMHFTGQQYMQLATEALSTGMNQQQLTEKMLSSDLAINKYGSYKGGSLGATRDQLKGIANDYLLPMSEDSLDGWVRRVASGVSTVDTYKDAVSQLTQGRFADPAIKDALQRGMSIREFADPYVQVAAQALGQNVNQIDLLDHKWSRPLDHVDDKGVRRSMTMDEWERKIKTDPTYGYDFSTNGVKEASQLVSGLRQQFGLA